MGADLAKIAEAISILDHNDDELWTADGLPRMDVIENLIGDASIIRKDVTDADPEFCREVCQQRYEDAQAAVEDAQAAADKIDEEIEDEQEDKQEEAQKVNPEEAIRDEIQEVGKAIAEIALEQAELAKASDKLKKLQARLQTKTLEQHTPEADTKARMVFIKSQHQQLMKRVEKGRKIFEVLGKDGITPRAPLIGP